MEELKVKLTACFDRLQNLQIKPTLNNMEILVQTLYDLRDVYNKLNEMEDNQNVGTEHASEHEENGSAADIPGRDDH